MKTQVVKPLLLGKETGKFIVLALLFGPSLNVTSFLLIRSRISWCYVLSTLTFFEGDVCKKIL